LRIEAGHGPWSVFLEVPRPERDITSYAALSFWIRVADGVPPKELYLQLRDKPEYSEPVTTERIPIFANIREGGIAGEYRRVVVPFSLMIGPDSEFQMGRLNRIIISGDAAEPSKLFIDGPRILATMDEPEIPAKPAPAK